MPEKLVGKPVLLISESKFSQLVQEVYGRPYRYQQQNFDGQDSIHFFDVPGIDEDYEETEDDRAPSWPTLKQWAETPLETEFGPDKKYQYKHQQETYWEREYFPDFEFLVLDLYKRGFIDAGKYGLHIWW